MRSALIRAAAAALLLFATSTAAAAAAFKVIVNEGNPATSITKAEARDLFTGKSTKWANGLKAEPADLAPGSSVRAAFSDAVLGKPVAAVQSYWQRQIFSGKGVPPPELASDAEVVSFVRRASGAIGYVSPGAATEGVKQVEVRD